MATFACIQCGAPFDARPSQGKRSCSRSCAKARVIAARHDPSIPRRKGDWTAEEDALLCRLSAEGVTGKGAASHVPHRTIVAIEQRMQLLRRWGLAAKGARGRTPKPKPPKAGRGGAPLYAPEQKSRTVELALTTALSIGKIAAEVGISPNQARRIIDAMQPKRPKIVSDTPKAREHRRRRGKTTISARPVVLAPENDPLPAIMPGAYLSPAPDGKGCVYPMWNGRPGPRGFHPRCDAPKAGPNYCAGHHAICFETSIRPAVFIPRGLRRAA